MVRGLWVGLGMAGCLLCAPRAVARTPQALGCASHVQQILGSSIARCRGRDFDGIICPRSAVDGARGRIAAVLTRLQGGSPPDQCIPRLCGTTDTPSTCAGKLVDGSGIPLDDPSAGWRVRDLLCLKKSAKVLRKLAQNAARCHRRASRGHARSGAFDLDGCLDTVLTETQDRLETLVTRFEDSGASAARCLLGGCAPDDDAYTCVDQVLNQTDDEVSDPGDEPDDPGDVPDDPGAPVDDVARCREQSAVVLQEFDQRVAKCHADYDRKGPDFDLSGCIHQARDKRESKLIGFLDEHVRPEQCFPGICTAGQTPAVCVDTVLELHAPGSGRG